MNEVFLHVGEAFLSLAFLHIDELAAYAVEDLGNFEASNSWGTMTT